MFFFSDTTPRFFFPPDTHTHTCTHTHTQREHQRKKRPCLECWIISRGRTVHFVKNLLGKDPILALTGIKTDTQNRCCYGHFTSATFLFSFLLSTQKSTAIFEDEWHTRPPRFLMMMEFKATDGQRKALNCLFTVILLHLTNVALVLTHRLWMGSAFKALTRHTLSSIRLTACQTDG